MKKKQVKKLLQKNNIEWKEFDDWMVGQTCPIEDGEMGYYEYDVDRFIRKKVNNDETGYVWVVSDSGTDFKNMIKK